MHGCSPALPSAAQTAGGVNREAHLKKRGKLKSSNVLQQPGHHSYTSSFSSISNICLIKKKSLHSSKWNFKSEQRYGYFAFVQRQIYICSFDVGAVWKGKERPQQESGRRHMTAAESLSCWWSFPQKPRRQSVLISSSPWLYEQSLAKGGKKSLIDSWILQIND